MTIAPLTQEEMPELEAFFLQVGLNVPAENLHQFAWPRRIAPGFETVTLGLRDRGRLAGVIGYLDLPLRIGGRREIGRWPINFFLLEEYQGLGLGRRLMEATREGARFRLVIGGNQRSMPVLERTGWQRIGFLSTFRWQAEARRAGEPPKAEVIAAPAPWADAAPRGENGVPRDATYLRFAFAGPLAAYSSFRRVYVAGEPAGYFVLALRGDVDVLDFDAVPGRETEVLEAALGTGLLAGDAVRLHASSRRFQEAARRIPGAEETPGLPIWLSFEEGLSPEDRDPGSWHLTHGDHDRYRILPLSRPWE